MYQKQISICPLLRGLIFTPSQDILPRSIKTLGNLRKSKKEEGEGKEEGMKSNGIYNGGNENSKWL